MSLLTPTYMAQTVSSKRRDSPEVDDQLKHCNTKCFGHEEGNQDTAKTSSDHDELMINDDDFEPLSQPFALRRSTDEDKDTVNGLQCKPIRSNGRVTTTSPTCVSALVRDTVEDNDRNLSDPSWTIQNFQEYLGMLELLQDVCNDAEGGAMRLSADCLGQMEQLLTSLLPQNM